MEWGKVSLIPHQQELVGKADAALGSHSWPSNTATSSTIDLPIPGSSGCTRAMPNASHKTTARSAELVKIPGRKDPQNNVFELVASWLQDTKKGTWLLVLDNADDDVVLSMPQASASKTTTNGRSGQLKRPLSAYLPQSVNGSLLVTTRTKEYSLEAGGAARRNYDSADE